ncbi:DUF3710 domain-containing protein [Haloechinothrix sp. LS1_15]|uniref:DUF3710 domain-containing protein n=1 Tax=Haloechinothrix sp. LS1_15 TaxID=2652248 RepID=UPI0029471E72|nr:DUF3710 domain-containing protein [Haloechinothrix sp. LS1_15]MDV6014457.1 DUF3710 domain-containing protein [Haloechinothrix sp. LS1_15]
MGIFGRKRRGAGHRRQQRGRHALPEDHEVSSVDAAGAGSESDVTDPDAAGAGDADRDPPPHDGPYDVAEAPQDSVPRMDLGSVRVPVPEGAQIQVEMDQSSGKVRAVHVVTPHGQVTISAYAAPRSGEIWPEVSEELGEQLRSDGATVVRTTGPWGPELSVQMGKNALHFVGVDGPRWMLRGVIAGPGQLAERAPETLRRLMRDTVVVRGDGPMPVRNPLPIKLPEAVAKHIAERREQQSG